MAVATHMTHSFKTASKYYKLSRKGEEAAKAAGAIRRAILPVHMKETSLEEEKRATNEDMSQEGTVDHDTVILLSEQDEQNILPLDAGQDVFDECCQTPPRQGTMHRQLKATVFSVFIIIVNLP